MHSAVLLRNHCAPLLACCRLGQACCSSNFCESDSPAVAHGLRAHADCCAVAHVHARSVPGFYLDVAILLSANGRVVMVTLQAWFPCDAGRNI